MSRRQILTFAAVIGVFALLSLWIGPRNPEQETQVALYAAEDAIQQAGGDPSDPTTAPGVPEQVSEFLRNGQFWRAARAMRPRLRDGAGAHPRAVLLAARAEAGWGGWERVREYLQGASWLDEVEGGDGWYWLARALEQGGDQAGALTAYGRYLSVAPQDAAERRRVAQLRQGLILLESGQREQGAEMLAGVGEEAPAVQEWVSLLSAEALAATGDTMRVAELLEEVERPGLWMRVRRALLRAHEEAGDPAGARQLALRFREQAGSEGARADLALRAGRLAEEMGQAAAARADYWVAVRTAPGSGSARTAADRLAELGDLSAEERLQLARVWDRHGADARAAREFRAWLEAGRGSAAEQRQVRLALGRALFEAGSYAPAISALQPLADASGSVGAEALFLIGRAEYRRGNTARADQIWLRLAERHPGSGPGAEGLFLVGDFAHDDGETTRAARAYRRVASEFRGTDRAGLSLMRLGGIAFVNGRYAEAERVWREYRDSYPDGERWLQASYWAARAREAAGDTAGAAQLYRAVRQRDPLSYYALRASERLGEPWWPVPTTPSPPDNPAARERVEQWMRGVDLLSDAGLHQEAEAEADRLIEQAGSDPALLYPLAEALNQRGLTVRGIRIGQRLQREAATPNERMLRILYPFPYRAMIAAEAREKELDPFVVAALTRQESLFKARISSPVGARGLMQLMPETGRLMARGVGIENWDAELLYQPEINAHLGTGYLADQMRKYRGALPAVFSAYNAGPHRIDRWMRFPEYRDLELFTERIPYRETRDYVKILTRNIALYRALYGEAE